VKIKLQTLPHPTRLPGACGSLGFAAFRPLGRCRQRRQSWEVFLSTGRQKSTAGVRHPGSPPTPGAAPGRARGTTRTPRRAL